MVNIYSEGGAPPSSRMARSRAALAACLGLAAIAAGCGSDAFDGASEIEGVGESQSEIVSLPAPVAYWKYDDACNISTVTDSSGNGATGTRLNGVGCMTDGRIESAG